MSELHPLRRGTILRRSRLGSVEVAVVLGPAGLRPDGVEAAHGWIDNPPDLGFFSISADHFRRGVWLIASDEDAVAVCELFLAHARGPDSPAWAVVDDGRDPWCSPPIAMRWTEALQTPRVEPAGPDSFTTLVRDLRAAGVPYEPDLSWPAPVRHQSALYVALGHLCKRVSSGPTDRLRRRVSAALDRVQAIGRRSRFAGWFGATAQGARKAVV